MLSQSLAERRAWKIQVFNPADWKTNCLFLLPPSGLKTLISKALAHKQHARDNRASTSKLKNQLSNHVKSRLGTGALNIYPRQLRSTPQGMDRISERRQTCSRQASKINFNIWLVNDLDVLTPGPRLAQCGIFHRMCYL